MLEHISGQTWCYRGMITLGIVQKDNRCVIIDTGLGESSARKCLRAILEKGWQVAALLCTHTHADHIGGHRFIRQQTGAEVIATYLQRPLLENPILEPQMLFGAFPPDGMRIQFIEAKSCMVDRIIEPGIVDIAGISLESIPLPGHTQDSIAWRTPDDIILGGDALFPQSTVDQYKISYYEDITQFRVSMACIADLTQYRWVWAHGGGDALDQTQMRALLAMNEAVMANIDRVILSMLPDSLENIIARVSAYWEIPLNLVQYHLLRVSVLAHLAALQKKRQISFIVTDRLIWRMEE